MMKRIKTFRSKRIHASRLQGSFISDIIFWLRRVSCDVSLDTHDAPPEVFEILSGTFAQWSEMSKRDFEKYDGRTIGWPKDNQLYVPLLGLT